MFLGTLCDDCYNSLWQFCFEFYVILSARNTFNHGDTYATRMHRTFLPVIETYWEAEYVTDNNLRRHHTYFMAVNPAFTTSPSCEEDIPETPKAPIILPST